MEDKDLFVPDGQQYGCRGPADARIQSIFCSGIDQVLSEYSSLSTWRLNQSAVGKAGTQVSYK